MFSVANKPHWILELMVFGYCESCSITVRINSLGTQLSTMVLIYQDKTQ